MTPKEKAQDIVNSFYLCMPFKDTKLTSCDESKDLIIKMEMLSAKQCALIAIDIKIYSYFLFTNIEYGDDSSEYWDEVKKEIELL